MDEDELRARHPSWWIWHGELTGKWWAAPLWESAPLELCEGVSLQQLEECMDFLERVH